MNHRLCQRSGPSPGGPHAAFAAYSPCAESHRDHAHPCRFGCWSCLWRALRCSARPRRYLVSSTAGLAFDDWSHQRRHRSRHRFHGEHVPAAACAHIDRDLLTCAPAGVARRRCLRPAERRARWGIAKAHAAPRPASAKALRSTRQRARRPLYAPGQRRPVLPSERAGIRRQLRLRAESVEGDARASRCNA